LRIRDQQLVFAAIERAYDADSKDHRGKDQRKINANPLYLRHPRSIK
jgi:hypothetical protein